MRIGIFGSSFNPIHLGHLIICEESRKRLDLDRVILVPTKNPYHKKVGLLAYEQRLGMTRLATEDNPYFYVSDIEKNIEGNSYTVDVLEGLRKDYPNDEFFFIIGMDSLINLDSWHEYEEILNMTALVVYDRPGYESDQALLDYYGKKTDLYHYDDLKIQISSSYIRSELAKGNSVKYLLTDRLLEYIEEKGFYDGL